MDEKIYYYRLPPSCRETLIRYVISESEKHYGALQQGWIFEDEVAALCAEEQHYTHSHVFAALAGDKICGSIRICRKMPGQVLPLEKLFSVNITALVAANTPVFHIGRFAVSQGISSGAICVFKTLMALALSEADKYPGGITFAECDCRLLRTIRHLGIEAQTLGKPVFYLGSETVPILLRHENYQLFLKRNQHLLGKEVPLWGERQESLGQP